jgi:hypothetical protein
MKYRHCLCPVILASAFLIVGLGLALEASAADQNPCSEDIAKFCQDLKPGQRALMECLEQHESELSDACKGYEAKMERPRAESREVVMQQMRVRQACREDVTKLCSDAKSASGGIFACLRAHTGEVSMPCKDALAVAKGGEEEKNTE